MTIAGKAAVTALGSGSIAIAGCYAGGLLSKSETAWSPLTLDSGFDNNYNTDTFVGKKYGKYLTGTGENNKAWWEQSFKKYETDKAETSPNFSSLFSNASQDPKVTSAFSTSDTKALNKVCEVAYKKNLTDDVDFTSPNNNTEEKYKLASDLLKYCSPLGGAPATIPENDSNYTAAGMPANAIGKQGQTKKLVSVTDATNEGFWKAQQEWFKELGKSTTSSPSDAYFGKFFSGADNAKTLEEGKTIKKICEDVYKKEAVSNGDATKEQPKIDDVVKYCTFQPLGS